LPPWQIKFLHWAAANQLDGQIISDYQKWCQAPFAKIFLFSSNPNQFTVKASGAQGQSQGEMNLVSGQLACRMIGAFVYGKTVWFWHPLLVLNSRRLVGPTGQTKPQSAGDGDNKNSSPGRARHKRKTIARGMPG
jgi:hypothetical protein